MYYVLATALGTLCTAGIKIDMAPTLKELITQKVEAVVSSETKINKLMHLGSYVNRKVFDVLHYAAADRVSKISPKKVIFLTIWVKLVCSI